MPFLPPNQQRQSTEGISTEGIPAEHITHKNHLCPICHNHLQHLFYFMLDAQTALDWGQIKGTFEKMCQKPFKWTSLKFSLAKCNQ